MQSDMQHHPISNVQWVSRSALTPNAYNPNCVFTAERTLLKQSIINSGWTMPIITTNELMIVDGYHRFLIAGDEDIAALTNGLVPITMLPELESAMVVAATIAHNRARGTDGVMKLAKVVGIIKGELGKDDAWIEQHMGMCADEIERLNDNAPSPESKGGVDFNSGWRPD